MIVTLLGCSTAAFTQQTSIDNTVGIIFNDIEKVSDGVVLYAPLHSRNVFLVDNCGSLLNQWEFDAHSNYSGAFLLEDGSVIKLVLSDKDGGGVRKDACIEHRSWDNVLLWKYCGQDRYAALHSDFYVLPNGNILSLLKDRYSIEAALDLGLKPENIYGNTFNAESIVEIKRTGDTTGEVVWEWHLWDHFIQEYDSLKNNYAKIEEQPRKLDINLIESNVHFNSIDYNEKLDQIVVSSWSDHEIYILDHSTSSETAATSTGGKYGYGGDFLYRWGNDANYNKGTQKLFGQHNPTWIPDDYGRFGGMISIFNNEHGYYTENVLKSAIVIINIDPNGDGVYEFSEKNTFEPTNYEYIWTGKIYDDWMLSRIMSGAEVQPNGNILICEATKGRFTEIDENGNIVWIYKSPDEGTENDLSTSRGIIDQGVDANPQVYKIKKYPIDYAPIRNIETCNNKLVENLNVITQQCIDDKKPNVSFEIKHTSGNLYSFEAEIIEADSIKWSFGDGDYSSKSNPSHQFKILGIYNVCLTAYNCFGSNEICRPVEINQTTSTDILQTELPTLNILPNPAKNYIKIISNNNAHNYIASICNIYGHLKMENINLNQTININKLQSGIYFVNLKNQSNFSEMMLKFIKVN